MDEEIQQWNQKDLSFRSYEKQVPVAKSVPCLSPLPFSKRKLSGQEKPRKILRSGTTTAYERRKVNETSEDEQVEQCFTDALDLIAQDNANSCPEQFYYVGDSVEPRSALKYLDNRHDDSVTVETRPVHCESLIHEPLSGNQSAQTEVATENGIQVLDKSEETAIQHADHRTITEDRNTTARDHSPVTEESSLGPHSFGLVPVQKDAQSASSLSSPCNSHCDCYSQLEQKLTCLEKQFTLLQNKHDVLQESHEKLAQLVEAQNHLLACHSAPPPTREALCTFAADESELIQSPKATDLKETSSEEPTTPETPRPVYEALVSSHGTHAPYPGQQLKLPRRVTAKDIIRLWEEGSRSLPPVKNWSPAQKMKVQSKLSRWKKIIDIFKLECNGDMENFEQKYSSENGDLLPVTTILALHENQLSSEFLSKGFSNAKQNTIDLKAPTEQCKTELDADMSELSNEETTTTDESTQVQSAADEGEKTNRYVLPRKVTARDVVQLWDSGCNDFPAIGTWTKAQKIGQETKIFRWRKIVDIFKKDCNSDWDLFTERYSNEKGELLPLATILAKHDAMYAQDQLLAVKQTALVEKKSDETHSPKIPVASKTIKVEKTSRDPDCVVLPRKVTAYEVVRYWTEGCETFGPVKDWTRAQKMGQETKISRWKKIYEIFRYQCYRDWDEFCRRYTNPRGELLPIATILAKYEAENPAGAPSYQVHGKASPEQSSPTSASQATAADSTENNPTDGDWALVEPTNVVVSVNSKQEYVLPGKLSPVEALSLWQRGTGKVPPINTWTEEQTAQKPLFTTIRKLAQIFEKDCGGHFRRFVERFSDTDGALLPISGIIYSNDARKYSPYFTEYEKSIKQSRSRGEQYELPKRVGAKEIVWLWEHGCREFPPVKAWSSAQKLRYTTKLSRWRKIVEIFHQKCDSCWRTYEEKYSNTNGELLAISTVISMQDEVQGDSYASMIKKAMNSPESDSKLWSESSVAAQTEGIEGDSEGRQSGNDGLKSGNRSETTDNSPTEFYLPRKVNALDIINFWECGFGNMPPVAEWSPLQKFRQRSKISRWSKIYDIYKNHCGGNLMEFEKLYTDKNGQLLPATTIISMYESRVDGDSCNGSFLEEVTAAGAPVVRRYVLPRKVDAKDIVRLWDYGNDDFPAIGSWTKADKIGQETKIFRWKKIVDIFKNHCGSDWTEFEELFSNEYGELLPTSVIIAKYETTCAKD